MAKTYKWFVSCALVCLLLSSSALPALAQAGSTPNGQALQTLESKFFEHTYPNDSEDDRIARLEKLIFGETKSGDVQSRLADIQKIVITNDAGSAKSSSTASSSGSATGSGSSAGSSNTSAGSSATASVPPSSASYPRVDALEELLLGQTNKTTPLEKRLATLEKKAFGHPSNSDDMSARTDSLEQYWQKSLSSSQNQKYDHALTQLEAQVIGQSYPDKPIIERLQTLEGIVFPNEPPDTHSSIKEQLETLANAVQISQKQGRKPSVSGAPDGAQSAGGYSDPSQTAASNAPGQYGSYGQANPYNSGQSGNYGTQTGYANTDHTYPGQSASSSYGSQGQYTTPTNTTTAQAPPSNYGQITPFANSPTTNESYGGTSSIGQGQEQQKNQGHPLLKGLAKALGAAAGVAGMAVGAMGTGMMYGGMGGYGYGSPYGMGGYGMSPYGMGMGGYGMGGYGMGGYGMGGYGNTMGRWW